MTVLGEMESVAQAIWRALQLASATPSLTLPLEEGGNGPTSTTEGASMAKILVVEDNEVNQRILVRRLERRGFEVVVAEDGAQGVEVARNEVPDLILMDMSLPTVDGWEATRQLKGIPATKDIPIIALTAHAMVGDRERAMAAGCDDYDVKPIELDRLLTKIDALLGLTSS